MQELEGNTNDANQEDAGRRKSDTISEEFTHNFNSGIIRKSEYFDLFISYKRDNGDDHGQKLAIELHEKLTANGYKVWLDNEEIGFSNNFEQRIEEAILHSKKVACILSPGWVESPNCRFEVQKAIEFEKRIIPIHYQEFRDLLKSKKDQGAITQHEWDRIDKPQEVNFSSKEVSRKGYEDLKAVCELNDHITAQHNTILCESYYWKKYNEPKSMLPFGTKLTKVKLLRSKCNSDDELPKFTNFQDEYITAAEKYVANEVSTNRQAYISYGKSEYEYASELNIELKLQGVKTWFDEIDEELSEESFIQSIMNCENVIDVISDKNSQEENVRIAYARTQNKRVLQVTDSTEILDAHRLRGDKNIYLWNDQVRIDELITTINGDAVYNAAHSKLLLQAFEWEKSEKSNGKLLPLKEAKNAKEWYQVAEKAGTEPQPNLSMVNFAERSVAYAETLRKRRIGLLWTGILGVLLIVILGFSAYWLQGEAKAAQVKAKNSTKLADKKQAEAKVAQEDARAAQEDAKKASKEADRQKQEANKEKKAAKQAKREAALAKEKADKANDEALEAKEHAKIATDEAKVATEAAKAANEAAEAAQKKLSLIDKKISASKLSLIAYNLTLDGNYIEAKQKADSAVALYNEIETEDFETDILYNTYYSILSKNKLTGEALSFVHEQQVLANESNYTHCGYATSADFDWAVVKKVMKDTSTAFSLTYTYDKKFGALGLKNGKVITFSAADYKLIDSISVGTYRVTSMGYNSIGSQLVASTVDGKFTIIPLNNSSGNRNKDKQMIRRESFARIEEILFEDDDTIKAIGGEFEENNELKKKIKLYPATVQKLTEILK